MRTPVLLSALLTSLMATSQVVQSVTNGPWNLPSTWDCACVPGPGQTVVVAHSVEILGTIQLMHPQVIVTAGAEITMSFPEAVTIATDLLNDGHILMIGTVLMIGQFTNNNFAEFIGELVSDGTIINGTGALIQVEGDLTNHFQMQGSGFVCVTDSVVNTGSISGTLDLCDQSNTAQQPPFIDSNTGTVAPTVTFCDLGPCTTGINGSGGGAGLRTVVAGDVLTVLGGEAGAVLELFDARGRRVMPPLPLASDLVRVPLHGLADGSYRAVLRTDKYRRSAAFVLLR